MRTKYQFIIAIIFICYKCTICQFQSFDETSLIGKSSKTGIDHSEKIFFEAHPNISLPLIGNTHDYYLNYNKYKKLKLFKNFFAGDSAYIRHFRFSIVFNPSIRMFEDNSQPVRMPSYKLNGSLAYFNIFKINKKRVPISLTLDHGHYSNGQDGSEFRYTEDGDSASLANTETLKNVKLDTVINRKRGNFSTNIIRVKGKMMVVLSQINGTHVGTALEVAATYIRYVDLLFGIDLGGYNPGAEEFYPMNQLNVECAHHKYYENGIHHRTGINYTYAPSKNEFIQKDNISLFGILYLSNSIGFFLKLEYGQDSYNLRFVDKISRVMGGFAWYFNEPSWLEFPLIE